MTKTVSLSELLDPRAVVVDLKGRLKAEVLSELVGAIGTAGLVADAPAALSAVQAREQVASTGCGSGVAVPHARLPGLAHTLLALGISKAGVEFGGVDNEPVKLIFLLLGSETEPEHYLKTLSQVARLIKESDFRQELLEAKDAQAVLDLIKARTT